METGVLSSSRRFRHSRQRFSREILTDKAGKEIGEGNYVFSDTRPFEGIHVSVAITNRYDRPGGPTSIPGDIGVSQD
jgi:hypothetical protein